MDELYRLTEERTPERLPLLILISYKNPPFVKRRVKARERVRILVPFSTQISSLLHFNFYPLFPPFRGVATPGSAFEKSGSGRIPLTL